ncbi:S-layer homology domain-containing protein [Peribacillus loiseleuriae]|uniref:S-layer homology domain-containing protein n=1 Tax=Peribacillus loiseleuriae TaxID=1679170 RepID=UPI000670FCD4|nr:S-layer homology domain-containing protein [Peribacillus loiseleuriae]
MGKHTKKIVNTAFAATIAAGSIVSVQSAQASDTGTASFSDVKPGSLYYQAVSSLSEKKIINGFPDGSFKPLEKLNRGQAAVILAKVLGLDTADVSKPSFTDVKISSYYYHAVAALTEAGVISGYKDGTFKPDKPVTRAEVAAMIVTGYKLQEEKLVDNPFKDIDAEAWYASYIPALLKNNIAVGTTSTTFSPNETVKRGDMALFIHRSEETTPEQN